MYDKSIACSSLCITIGHHQGFPSRQGIIGVIAVARSTDIVEKAKSAVNLAYALSKLQKPVLVMNANLITAEVAALSDSISLAAAVSLKEKSW